MGYKVEELMLNGASTYVLHLEEWRFILPEGIVTNKEGLDTVTALARESVTAYQRLLELGIPPEKAEYVLLPHVMTE